jgi:hypothetical protein
MSNPVPNRQALVDLLFPSKQRGNTLTFTCVLDGQLFLVARNEIEGLRHKLNRQSTMLAEALKERDEEWARSQRLNAANVHLQAQLDNVVLEKNVVNGVLSNVREANARLVESESKLKDELARLKPPVPKFRVGQVVTVLGGELWPYTAPYTIKIVKVTNEHGRYKYTCSITGLNHEEVNLRGLTDEEK